MLVKFHSSTSGEIMMFAETARTLLRILKKDCTARGVITLEQLPDEIALLRAAIERDAATAGKASESAGDGEGGEGGELPIGFRQRATPFLELLKRTLGKKGYLLWEAPSDFGSA